jgi:hypothetical protein
VDVEENGIHDLLLEHLERLLSSARFDGLEAEFGALLREGPTNQLVVVDNQNPFLSHAVTVSPNDGRGFIAAFIAAASRVTIALAVRLA